MHMTKEDFVKLMNYPKEWLEWDMLPDIVLEIQMNEYEPGHEQSSEHNRNGAFQFWIRGDADEEQLIKLVKLSKLDPEEIMCRYIREKYIPKCAAFSERVADEISKEGI
jgi:hypothetical protein